MYNQYIPMYTQGRGLFAGLKKIGFSNILTNTQKTLNIVNQAIPIVYQVKPIVNNAKTLFKVAGAMRDNSNSSNTQTSSSNKVNNIQKTNSNKPQFYI